MTIRCFQVQAVNPLQLLDFLDGFRRKGRFAFKGVQDDAFEQVTQGDVLEVGEPLEHFQQARFEANAAALRTFVPGAISLDRCPGNDDRHKRILCAQAVKYVVVRLAARRGDQC